MYVCFAPPVCMHRSSLQLTCVQVRKLLLVKNRHFRDNFDLTLPITCDDTLAKFIVIIESEKVPSCGSLHKTYIYVSVLNVMSDIYIYITHNIKNTDRYS